MEKNMSEMYELVFEDMIKNYIEEMEEDDKIEISDEEITKIAKKLIYKNEYIWEVINDAIDYNLAEYITEEETQAEEPDAHDEWLDHEMGVL